MPCLLAGCGQSIAFIGADAIPDGVDLVALLPLLEEGPASGTPLLSVDGAERGVFDLPAGAGEIAMVGYARATLPFDSEDSLRDRPLRAARLDEPTLPSPDWSATLSIDGDRVSFEAPPDLGPLTADFARCDFDPERHYVHVRCVSCSPFVELTKHGCELQVDTKGCFFGIDSIRVPLDGLGGFGEPSAPPQRCMTLADPGDSRLAFECTLPQAPLQCRFDLIEKVPPESFPFSVTERALVSRPLAQSDFTTRLEPYGRGYVHDLVVLDDRVVATVHDREPSNWYCGDGGSGTFVMLDPDTLETVSTATAPPCLYTMAPSQRPDEFFAAFGTPLPNIGRFDAGGQLLDARSLAPSLPYAFGKVIDLTVQADGSILALVNENPANIDQVDLAGTFLEIDPISLEVRRSETLDGNLGLLRTGPDGIPVAVHLELESILRFEPDGPVFSPSFRFLCDAAALRVGDYLPLGGDRHLLLGRQLYPFVFSADFAVSSCSRDAVAEVEADPSSILTISEDRFLVSTRGRDATRTAQVLRFDPERNLLLPGAIEIGHGLTRLRRIDAKGRVFGVAVESGHVFRLDPR